MNEKLLIDFGNYLLSLERETRMKENPLQVPSYEERFREVTHADLENFKVWMSK